MPENLINSTQLAALRKQLKRQRARLSTTQQQQAARRALRHLVQSRVVRAARSIAIYLPVRGELDPTLVRASLKHKADFYLPILSLSPSQGLVFVRWNQQTRFRLNRFAIQEPLLGSNKQLAPMRLDVVIMPLVAADQKGHRLGMGGGFYDRSFAAKRRQCARHIPWLIGYAHDFQVVEQLPTQPWDVSLDGLCTPKQLIWFKR